MSSQAGWGGAKRKGERILGRLHTQDGAQLGARS